MTALEAQERLATAMLRPINPAAIIILGIFTVVWGLWVGNPFWEVFPSAELFSAMSAWSEPWWGFIACLTGVVIIQGAISRSYRSLVLGCGFGGMFWFVISIMFFIGDWHNTGGITALAFACYAAFVYLNLRVNNKHVEDDNDLFVG